MTREHPARFDLERFSVGEPKAGSAQNIIDHLEHCESCSSFVKELELAREEQLLKAPPRSFYAKLETRMGEDRARNRSLKKWYLGAAVAAPVALALALGLFFVASTQKLEQGVTPQSTMRWMGDQVAVKNYVLREGKVQPFLKGQDILRDGDRLRFEVVLPQGISGFAAVVAVENKQGFALLPASNTEPPYSVKGRLALPGSVHIESGGEPVRLLLIVRAEPFVMDELMLEVGQTAKIDGALNSVRGFAQEILVDLETQ